jgi:hypothetical protein
VAGADPLLDVAERALEWARRRDHAGWSKHDALDSPLLAALSLGRKWPRIALIQAVMRCPFNVRPLLGVRPRRDPKGIALFARAWLDHHAITGRSDSALEAERLLDWLVENPSSAGFPGMSWGYPYPWQDPGFHAPAGFPNRIVTYFVIRALVHGWQALGRRRWLEAAEEGCRFVLEAPRILEDTPELKCVSYVPLPSMTMAVMDVSPLCGSACAMVGVAAGRPRLVDEGRRLVAWAVDKQTPAGAWYYTHPPGDSHLKHDNYHTGEIIEALREYGQATGDTRFEAARRAGLEHYRRDLFTSDWRPKWMSHQRYPHDVHGYAVGILVFAGAGDFAAAGRIAQAALEDLWNDRQARFHHQRRRLFIVRTTLMRWCQAWMCHALLRLAALRSGRAT